MDLRFAIILMLSGTLVPVECFYILLQPSEDLNELDKYLKENSSHTEPEDNLKLIEKELSSNLAVLNIQRFANGPHCHQLDALEYRIYLPRHFGPKLQRLLRYAASQYLRRCRLEIFDASLQQALKAIKKEDVETIEEAFSNQCFIKNSDVCLSGSFEGFDVLQHLDDSIVDCLVDYMKSIKKVKEIDRYDREQTLFVANQLSETITDSMKVYFEQFYPILDKLRQLLFLADEKDFKKSALSPESQEILFRYEICEKLIRTARSELLITLIGNQLRHIWVSKWHSQINLQIKTSMAFQFELLKTAKLSVSQPISSDDEIRWTTEPAF